MSAPRMQDLEAPLEQSWRRLERQGLIAGPAAMSLRVPRSWSQPESARVSESPRTPSPPQSANPPHTPNPRGSESLRLLVCGADGRIEALEGAAPPPSPALALHTMIYEARPDVGAIAVGGGPFGRALAGFGGVLPQVFDEQARHLGGMPEPVSAAAGPVRAALSRGGNALLIAGQPVCLGMTAQRLVFNAELFEKCAEAWLLASATGARVGRLPWWVRRIANGRLRRDARRAAQRFGAGELPEETSSYG